MRLASSLPRQAVADYRAAALTTGRYDLLAMEYAYPLTIYVGGEVQLVSDPADIVRFYAGFHSAMKGRGLHSFAGRVTAEEMPVNKRFRVWTEWSAKSPDGRENLVAATVCYCSITGETVATEMIEFSRLELPLMAA